MRAHDFPTDPDLNLRQIPQFCEEFPAFDEPEMRALVSNSRKNGLDAYAAIVRINRRLALIDVDRFFAWIESLREGVA